MPYGNNIWSNMIITNNLMIKFSRISLTYMEFVLHVFQQQAQLYPAMTFKNTNYNMIHVKENLVC